jgi:adenine-specific DNA-methyltransferase
LYSNYVSLATFLGTTKFDEQSLTEKINYLNNLSSNEDNYFSINFGNRYFSKSNARKIGLIRDTIEEMNLSKVEKLALISSLIYAADKAANTVGHYDAYREKLDNVKLIKLLIPKVITKKNANNVVFCKDANKLIREIRSDILYIDPPYNSRQYCDTYHLLENLAQWEKPPVFGKARKMDRSKLKSEYCFRKKAVQAFSDLIDNANCRFIIVSYNSTGNTRHSRSNSLISDNDIVRILNIKGDTNIFEMPYNIFDAGKTENREHSERLFLCRVN